jgi:hypothetical protein
MLIDIFSPQRSQSLFFFLLSAERAESKKQSAFGKHHTGNKQYALASI